MNEILTHKEEMEKQINEALEYNNKLRIGNASAASLSYETHSEAIYTNRLLDFDNLPKPKNSDDYYDQSNNIISNEFSESLQINISQLNINDEQIDEDKKEMEMSP
ncbi:uncharacterized protein OCT59_023772 [Rhizophagus irregularis]|nr:hypothetical protein OCT59_023772 [Rhizophagus irregularis]GBC20772.2 kinase-like domain-containing protein [Rhizophagus irregularis DAOM 181602=DAOM 197198]